MLNPQQLTDRKLGTHRRTRGWQKRFSLSHVFAYLQDGKKTFMEIAQQAVKFDPQIQTVLTVWDATSEWHRKFFDVDQICEQQGVDPCRLLQSVIRAASMMGHHIGALVASLSHPAVAAGLEDRGIKIEIEVPVPKYAPSPSCPPEVQEALWPTTELLYVVKYFGGTKPFMEVVEQAAKFDPRVQPIDDDWNESSKRRQRCHFDVAQVCRLKGVDPYRLLGMVAAAAAKLGYDVGPLLAAVSDPVAVQGRIQPTVTQLMMQLAHAKRHQARRSSSRLCSGVRGRGSRSPQRTRRQGASELPRARRSAIFRGADGGDRRRRRESLTRSRYAFPQDSNRGLASPNH